MKNPHIFVLLAFLILAGMIVSPALAYRYEETAPEGQAIYVLQIYSDGNTNGTIYLYQSNGDYIWGGWTYSDWVRAFPADYRIATVSVGQPTNYVTVNYIYPLQLVTNFQPLYSNGSKLEGTIGQTKFIADEKVNVAIKPYPFVKFLIVSDKDVSPTVRYISIDAAKKDINPLSNDDIFSIIKGYWNQAWGIFTALAYWLKFLLWDHLIVLVVLYLTGTMAYYMNTSKNIFIFYTRWFKGLAGLFHFIANIYSIVISIITQIALALKLL